MNPAHHNSNNLPFKQKFMRMSRGKSRILARVSTETCGGDCHTHPSYMHRTTVGTSQLSYRKHARFCPIARLNGVSNTAGVPLIGSGQPRDAAQDVTYSEKTLVINRKYQRQG